MRVIVDTSDFKKYEKILKSMRKSDFPLAIRGTLNDLAFDVKKRTMPHEFKDQFDIRRPTFLKSHSGVERCDNTFNINAMSSKVGIYNKAKEIVGTRLAMQETNGSIKDRSVPTENTRIGGSMLKKQMLAMYYRKFRKKSVGVISSNSRGAIIKTKSGNIVWHSRNAKFENGQLVKGQSKLLYYHRESVPVKDHPFLYPASEKTASEKSKEYFEENALKRISKYKGKL